VKKKNIIHRNPNIIRNIQNVSNGINNAYKNKNVSVNKTVSINKKDNVPTKLKILTDLNDLSSKSSNKVFIVGGGPSLQKFDFKTLEGHDVIAVNKSIEYVDKAKYFLTMDYTFLKKTNLSIDEINRKSENTIFVLNNTPDYIRQINGVFIDTRSGLKYENLSLFNNIIVSNSEIDSDTGFGITLDNFQHGSNSGYCALQLALLLGYEEIYLLGFDLNNSKKLTHFHQGYKQNINQFENRLNQYRKNFIISLKLLKTDNIFSTSNNSYLNTYIKFVPYHIALKNKIIPTKKNQSTFKSKGDLRGVVFVSYYTINTPYEQESAKLIKSLNKLNLRHDVVGVPNLGNWQANTRFKAKFMLEMLDKHVNSKLVWVDSDAVIHSRPELFSNYDCDVAVRWQDFRWRKNECLSGTIYMDNNEKTREICRRWLSINDNEGPNAKTFEQWNLGSVIKEMESEGKIRTRNLPPEYTFIFDSMRKIYPNAVPVIEHFQASRKLRNKV
jgi:hypothetical protein